jgi:endonuclease G
MYLRKIAVGLSALVLLSTGAQARSLLDLLKPPAQHQEQVSHSGSISQGAALDLYSNKQKQASFDGLLINFTLIAKTRLKDCSGHKMP